MIARKNPTDEGITFYDEKKDEITGQIEAPFMNDASGEAYSEAITFDLTEDQKINGKYLLTMTIDETYLDDPNRQYPITIDPTHTWTGTESIADAYVISGNTYKDTNFYSSSTKIMPVGINSTGTHRTYVKILNLKAKISGKYVDNAQFTIYENGSGASQQKISAYRVTESWTASSLKWSNKPANAAASMATITTKKTAHTANTFNLRAFARNVANGSVSNYGVVLRNTTSAPGYACFYGSRSASTSYRPKLKVVYYDGPAKATKVTAMPKYLNGSKGTTIAWEGIKSQSLKSVEYRAVHYNSSDVATNESTSVYKTLKTTTTSSGKATITSAKDWAAGKYRVYIRGVDNGGIKGSGVYTILYVDKTKPKLTTVNLTKSTQTSVYTGKKATLSYSGASDTYLSHVEYAINSGAYTKMGTGTSGSVEIDTGKFSINGDNTVKVRAVDKAGNTSAVITKTFYADRVSPTTGQLSLKDRKGEKLMQQHLQTRTTRRLKSPVLQIMLRGLPAILSNMQS